MTLCNGAILTARMHHAHRQPRGGNNATHIAGVGVGVALAWAVRAGTHLWLDCRYSFLPKMLFYLGLHRQY